MKTAIKLSVVLLLIGGGFGGYEFYDFANVRVPELDAQSAAKQSELQGKKTELERLRQFATNIESIKKELRELNFQLEAALEHMPRQFNLAALLRRLSLLAQNSGIEMFSFKPQKGEEKKQDQFYSTIGIDFQLKGSYTQTLVFLDQLTRLKRIISVENIQMRVGQQMAQRSGNLLADTNATIKTYRFAE